MSEKTDGPDSVAPALLLSMPQLTDPNFRQSVVLLCQHSPEGSWGLVLNRPTNRAATMVTDEGDAVSNGLEVWLGGPVELESGCILIDQMPEEGEALRICDGLFLSGSQAFLQRLMKTGPAGRVRLLMGYAGWGPGQLEEELRQSAWLISDVALDIVFDTAPAAMWETAIRRLGADPATLQMSPGVH
jgi:putative transcriptional regulator